MNKAIFLDRDGVINYEIGRYVTNVNEFKLVEGVGKNLKTLQDKGYLLIVITNQGGIAKELYTQETLHEIHRVMLNMLEKSGVRITDIYHCPHHPDFTGPCLCRKPGSLMLEKAIARYHIDKNKSYFIGDNDRDEEAGKRAGVSTIRIKANSGLEQVFVIVE